MSKYLTSQIAEHWAILIGQGLSLDERAEWTFKADLDPEKEVLQIGGAKLDLTKDPVAKLAEVASKLSQLAKELGPVLQRRHAEEQRRGRPGGRGVVRDTGYLRNLGLDDLADRYERELDELAGPEADGEEDPDFDRVEPRPERDLATEAGADATEDADADAGEAAR